MKEFGIDQLRRAVRVLDWNNESFNQCYTAEELLKLVEIGGKVEWDVMLDCWEKRQIEEAIKGIVPQWKEDEFGNVLPVYEDFSSIQPILDVCKELRDGTEALKDKVGEMHNRIDEKFSLPAKMMWR